MTLSALQDFADDLTLRLGAPVGISDLQFDHLVAGPQPSDVDWVRRDSLLERVTPSEVREYFIGRGVVPTMPAFIATDKDADRGISARWIVALRFAGRTFGYLWVLNSEHAHVSQAAVEDVLPDCEKIGLHLHRHQMNLRSQSGNLKALLTEHPSVQHEAAAELYEVAGYPSGPVAILVMAAAGPSRDALTFEPGALDGLFPRTAPGEIWRMVEGTRAILMAPPGTLARDGALMRIAEHARDVARRSVGPESRVVVGLGDVVNGLHEVGRSFRQARLAVKAALAIQAIPEITAWSELGAMRALLSIPDDALKDAVAPGVMTLAGEQGFLIETLETYFSVGGNVNEAAERLKVSRGTVYYRLQRAENSSQLSLRSGPDRISLEVGLMILRLLDQTTHPVEMGKVV